MFVVAVLVFVVVVVIASVVMVAVVVVFVVVAVVVAVVVVLVVIVFVVVVIFVVVVVVIVVVAVDVIVVVFVVVVVAAVAVAEFDKPLTSMWSCVSPCPPPPSAKTYHFLPVPDNVRCPLGHVRCDSGQCIPRHKWCNHWPNCPDKSDEKNCGKVLAEGWDSCSLCTAPACLCRT